MPSFPLLPISSGMPAAAPAAMARTGRSGMPGAPSTGRQIQVPADPEAMLSCAAISSAAGTPARRLAALSGRPSSVSSSRRTTSA